MWFKNCFHQSNIKITVIINLKGPGQFQRIINFKLNHKISKFTCCLKLWPIRERTRSRWMTALSKRSHSTRCTTAPTTQGLRKTKKFTLTTSRVKTKITSNLTISGAWGIKIIILNTSLVKDQRDKSLPCPELPARRSFHAPVQALSIDSLSTPIETPKFLKNLRTRPKKILQEATFIQSKIVPESKEWTEDFKPPPQQHLSKTKTKACQSVQESLLWKILNAI